MPGEVIRFSGTAQVHAIMGCHRVQVARLLNRPALDRQSRGGSVGMVR